jgi:hypothetical protein
MPIPSSQQLGLFQAEHMRPALSSEKRGELVRLVEQMLTEAIAVPPSQPKPAAPKAKEAGHEQDHA